MEPRTEREKFTSAMPPIADSPENAERLESTLGSESKNWPRLVRQFMNGGAEVSVSISGMIVPRNVAPRLRTTELSIEAC